MTEEPSVEVMRLHPISQDQSMMNITHELSWL
jgi:hypothetical protein